MEASEVISVACTSSRFPGRSGSKGHFLLWPRIPFVLGVRQSGASSARGMRSSRRPGGRSHKETSGCARSPAQLHRRMASGNERIASAISYQIAIVPSTSMPVATPARLKQPRYGFASFKIFANKLTKAMNSSARSGLSWMNPCARGLRKPLTAPENICMYPFCSSLSD